MNVKVTLAGQDIEVPVTPEQEAELRKQCAADTEKQYEIQFMSNFFRESSQHIRHIAEFTEDETNLLVDELHHIYPNIQAVGEAVAFDTYLKQVQEFADGIVAERVKIYRVTVQYSGEFEVLVKAHNKDEAEDFVGSLSDYDLAQYADPVDAEYEVDYTAEDDTIEEWAVDLDATE